MVRSGRVCEGDSDLPVTISGTENYWNLEVLKQLYGKSLQDAADCLGVSRSTMKRICRKHGISRWPSYKRRKTERFCHKQTSKNELLQGSERAISCNSPGVYLGTSSAVSTSSCSTTGQSIRHELELQLKQTQVNLLSPHSVLDSLNSARALPEILLEGLLTDNTNFTIRNSQPHRAKKQIPQCNGELPSNLGPHLEKIVNNADSPAPNLSYGAATQGEMTASIKIKAKYGEDIMRFSLHYTSALADLEREVQKRLNLKLGTFTLKYLDDENDWIRITCDEDLQELFRVNGLIRMLIFDINNL